MKQAYQHLEPSNTHYKFINDQIAGLVKKWNSTHTKQTDPKVIGEAFKTIFKYHRWIAVDDIQTVIDLGLMGHFGENKGLNTETIFSWFKSNSAQKRENLLKNHTAYEKAETFIPIGQRKQTRNESIQVFMKWFNHYKETRELGAEFYHYVPVFFRWFKKLGYIHLDPETEVKMQDEESKALHSLRSKLTRKPKEHSTVLSIFMEAFKLAVDNNYDILPELLRCRPLRCHPPAWSPRTLQRSLRTRSTRTRRRNLQVSLCGAASGFTPGRSPCARRCPGAPTAATGFTPRASCRWRQGLIQPATWMRRRYRQCGMACGY